MKIKDKIINKISGNIPLPYVEAVKSSIDLTNKFNKLFVVVKTDGGFNIVSHKYKELEKNHVLSFAKQGGVYKDVDGAVVYGNEFKDFDNPAIRAEYNFPLPGLKERIAFNARKIFKVYPKVKRLIKP